MTTAAYEHTVSTEKILLDILRNGDVQTIDGLVEASGLEWSRVFLAIDRLSRSGDISLQRAGRLHYQVRVTRENACA